MIDATTIALMKKMISKYGGGSGSSADISAAIKQYLKDNPITAESIGAERKRLKMQRQNTMH